MQRSIENYLREVPFVLLPMTIVLAVVLFTRFLIVPQRVELRELQGKEAALPTLHKEQAELLKRLRTASGELQKLPEYESISFTDGASLISELFRIAGDQGITFTKSHPSVRDGKVIVEIAFTGTYETLGNFLTKLEQYPMQLSVSQVALTRKSTLLSVALTVTGYPQKELQ